MPVVFILYFFKINYYKLLISKFSSLQYNNEEIYYPISNVKIHLFKIQNFGEKW